LIHLVCRRTTWAEGHVQRTEPSGEVVAQYKLPQDAEFCQTLSNSFATAVLSTIGDERGKLLLQYSNHWLQDLGLVAGGDGSLTVRRYGSGAGLRLGLEVKSSGNSMATDVSPHQPFPEAFLPLFPNGWPDLAKREGFELPKEFSK
jgi:hypothetical protein